ncbi:PAS domain-containing protein [Mangrovicoccus sp. HB161399]|uniref:PAS domain-containing protein n=1 Tax=Mangrovicoccus sp. HB161399 TaxID=2720392 RepID=UPI001554DA61|nr:PAS domain-containing protein [Mangrovicoccus sp. HB161399]
MSLLSALAQYSLVNSRIDALLQRDEPDTADLSLLLRQASDLRGEVLGAAPRDPQEAAQKLACIVNLIQRDAQMQGFAPELSALLDAAQEACGAIGQPERTAAVPCMTRPSGARPAAHFGGSVADYVAFAEGRLSLIGTDYCLIATSEETARHFGRQQISLMGMPLAEVIGRHRFETRARARLDACFAGKLQTYHVALPDHGRATIMRCDMRPVNSGEGGILGALVYMTDVTQQVKRLRPDQDLFAVDMRHGA